MCISFLLDVCEKGYQRLRATTAESISLRCIFIEGIPTSKIMIIVIGGFPTSHTLNCHQNVINIKFPNESPYC